MFNATTGRQASTAKIEARSDRIAANLEDRLTELSLDDREALMDRLDAVVASTDTTKSFVAGTYAQNSSGQPAQALGSGNTGSTGGSQPPTEQEALDALMNSPRLSGGIKNALRRILNPRDPEVIAVDNDGTPSDVAALTTELRRERSDTTAGSLAHKAKEAERKLTEERDPNKTGSLAKQLADAQAAVAVPAGMLPQAEMQRHLAAIVQAEAQLHSSMLSTTIDNRPELQQAITDAQAFAS